jgi:hypothetical protein
LRKASEYEAYAEECRKLASGMKNPTHKMQLEQMADAWTMLAGERAKQRPARRWQRADQRKPHPPNRRNFTNAWARYGAWVWRWIASILSLLMTKIFCSNSRSMGFCRIGTALNLASMLSAS